MASLGGNFCECRCGYKAGFYPNTDKRSGQVKGEPRRFLPGHHMSKMTAAKLKHDMESQRDAEEFERIKLVKNAMQAARKSGKTGDEAIKEVLAYGDVTYAIIEAQLVRALDGQREAANWLFARGIGNATPKSKDAAAPKAAFLDPTDSEDELYE